MQDNNRLIAHLFALGTTIVWGTTFISSKILLESLTPSEIIVYRFAIAIAFLSPTSSATGEDGAWKPLLPVLDSAVSPCIFSLKIPR